MNLQKGLFIAGFVCAILAVVPATAAIAPWLAIGLACVAGGLLLA